MGVPGDDFVPVAWNFDQGCQFLLAIPSTLPLYAYSSHKTEMDLFCMFALQMEVAA